MNRTRLILETTYNTRELGGLPIDNKRQVKWGVLLRSDDVSKLSKKDQEELKAYGMDTVIDLRTPKEREATGYVLGEDLEIAKHYISLMISDDVADITKSGTNITLGDFYCEMLDECQPLIKEIFEVFSNPQNKGILFHCAAGKDRTGVVAALLLKTLGVLDSDVIANYEVTYSHLSVNPEIIIPKEQQHLLYSNRSNMVRFLEKLTKDYGTVENYLKTCGLSQEEIESIQNKYIEA